MAKQNQKVAQKNIDPAEKAADVESTQAPGQETEPQGVFAGVELKNRKHPEEVVKNLVKGKSAAIRALSAHGYTHAEITKLSKKLPILQYEDGREIRYQHVRNVLMQPLKGSQGSQSSNADTGGNTGSGENAQAPAE